MVIEGGMFVLKRKIMMSILIITIVSIAIVSFLYLQTFNPKKIINDKESVTITRVLYHGVEISFDENKLINILNKYNAKKTFQDYFPYQTSDIDIEIDMVDNLKPKHIYLGKFNIWCESANDRAYDILNAQQLKDELINILGTADQ